MKIFGLCIHGLFGDLFPLGMDKLAATLNKNTPAGVHFTVVGGNDPDAFRPMIEQAIDAAVERGEIIILIGHSLGADMVVTQCNRLLGKTQVPIAGVVDPVDWTGTHSAGIWEVDRNVDLVINPYQDQYPGGGHVVRVAGNEHTDIHLMHMPQYPHASMTGYDIASCPETQTAMLEAVQNYIAHGAKT